MSQPLRLQSAKLLHVAIIMDGNRRWARAQGLTHLAGHKAGMEAVRRAVAACPALGVNQLTLYAFSTENWRRPKVEINGLMRFFKSYMQNEIDELAEKGVCVRFIGDRTQFDKGMQRIMKDTEQRTGESTRLAVNVAMNYGSRDEITAAMRAVAEKVRSGALLPEQIDEACVAQHLYTKDIPDPDLLIRTSGEVRLSNFLLWQLAYTEMVFLDTYWPDFTKDDFAEAIRIFQTRERRFGASKPAVAAQI